MFNKKELMWIYISLVSKLNEYKQQFKLNKSLELVDVISELEMLLKKVEDKI